MIRASISGISQPDHLIVTLNGAEPLDISSGFPTGDDWAGSRDRRWIEIHNKGLMVPGENSIEVRLTDKGKAQEEPQGGKILSSIEVLEYGGDGR
jgi:hypothetical protein